MPLFTIGHGTLTAERFVELLRDAGIQALVDVRTAPGSRRNPQFGRDAMAEWLPAAGVDYRWEKALGGFRKTRTDSPNVALRNTSFRGYADYMETAAFGAALDRLLAEAGRRPTAILCAESVWWRCHRRMIADAAVLRHRVDVIHLMHDGRQAPHAPTAGVRVDGERLVYDVVEEPELPLVEKSDAKRQELRSSTESRRSRAGGRRRKGS